MSHSLSKSLGSFTSYSKTAEGLSLKSKNGQLDITFYSDKIVRIWAFQNQQPEDFSYAVVGTPQTTAFSVALPPIT
jgi:hypothetical protein